MSTLSSSSSSLLNSKLSAYPTQSCYSNGTDSVSSDLSSGMSKLEPLLQNEERPVKLHPLIIGNDVVVCMPEVNKVLRNVYQVLSQANYYLSKHGISSRRFTGAQLIKIKMLGILNHDAKVCSYILQQEAERIFDNFDLTGSSRKSQQIIWIDPILLDESPANSESASPSHRGQNKDNISPLPVEIQTFLLGSDVIVCAPDIQKVIQNHFNQGATTGYYFSKLGIVPYKFIHSAHLDKVKELGIIKKSAVHCTYVSKNDAIKVFEAYGMTTDDIKYSKIKWLNPVVLQEINPGLPPINLTASIKEEKITSPLESPVNAGEEDNLINEDDISEDDAPENDSNSTARNDPNAPLKVHPFIIEGKEVVCMPDVHRVVQSAHGNSIQVNYYLNKLHVKKKRFCFAHLRELKGRSILQNNATYCTHIPKADAEKIFQVYTLMGDTKISNLDWGEPISLDYGENGTKGSIHINTSLSPDGLGQEDGIKVHTFCVDGDIVVCTPDVHKIVDFLEEQSASLDYHFRKLGIMKHRYTYSQLHQLRRLQVIKRPTVCTFIKKLEVERLLLMYATEHNRKKIQRVRWKEPIPLVASDHGPQPNPESPVGSPYPTMHTTQSTTLPPTHTTSNATADHGHQRESTPTDYTISDLYSVFVGDKAEGHSHEGSAENHSGRLALSSPTRNTHSLTSPTTAAMEFQRANPHIDCPIVIPSADFDPMRMCSTPLSSPHSITTFTNSHAAGRIASPCDTGHGHGHCFFRGKRPAEDDEESQSKKSKAEYTILERLLKDLHRKETELRVLHDAYQKEIELERDKRLQAEKETDVIKEELNIERQLRERLERDHIRAEGGRNLERCLERNHQDRSSC